MFIVNTNVLSLWGLSFITTKFVLTRDFFLSPELCPYEGRNWRLVAPSKALYAFHKKDDRLAFSK